MTEREAQQPLRVVRGVLPVVGTVLAVSVSSFSTVASAQDSAATVAPSAAKAAVIRSIDRHRPELVSLSDQIWAFAEIALREHRSAKLLADYAEKQGFRVERGIAGMPTAFVASYGNGRPVIGIMGEYDALPGLSQKAQPSKEPLVAGAGWSWLRAQHVWRRESRRRACDQGADPVGSAQGHDSFLRHAGRGGHRRQDLHGARRRVQRRRRDAGLAPGG